MGLPKPDRQVNTKSFDTRRLNFIKLTEGQHIIRILQPIDDVKLAYTHWVNGMTIECPGQDCPICINNREILASVDNSWEDARKITGFLPYQIRYYVNVLDRTPVKVAPSSETGFENKKSANGEWPVVCAETGEYLADVPARPSNKVKILAGGKTLFIDLENIHYANINEEGDAIGIHNYDIVLMVKGVKRERKVTPVHQINRNDTVDVTEYDEEGLFDLDRALISLEPEEINDFRRGVSLKDIFSARRLKEQSKEVVSDSGKEDELSSLEDKSEELSDKLSDFMKGV